MIVSSTLQGAGAREAQEDEADAERTSATMMVMMIYS